MPLFKYKCTLCDKRIRRITPTDEGMECPDCHVIMRRDSSGPTSRLTETLDNGIMSRPLERLDNAEEIYRDRSRPDRDPRNTQE